MEFVEELRLNAPAAQPTVVLEAPIGPRGDAYAPSSMMSAEEAERYHAAQIADALGHGGRADTALTVTYAEEAIGMVRAARSGGPAGRGLLHRRDRRPLPSGQSLRAAIEQVDAETDGAPLHYMINCAHPTHFEGALRTAIPGAAGSAGCARTPRRAATPSWTRPRSSTTAIPPISRARHAACAARCRTSRSSAAAAAPTSGTSRASPTPGSRRRPRPRAYQAGRNALMPGVPGSLDVSAGGKAARQLEHRHPVRERPGGAGAVGVLARREIDRERRPRPRRRGRAGRGGAPGRSSAGRGAGGHGRTPGRPRPGRPASRRCRPPSNSSAFSSKASEMIAASSASLSGKCL